MTPDWITHELQEAVTLCHLRSIALKLAIVSEPRPNLKPLYTRRPVPQKKRDSRED